ncbi:MAG: hypothetical protein IJU81_01535 [Bacteroidales bacterium]|nr:hypothetical protein [Bacteroidales bacterium]
MMYRPQKTRRKPSYRWLKYAVAVMVVVAVGVAVSASRLFRASGDAGEMEVASLKVERRRLLRSALPHINMARLDYRRTFSDINDLQLEAAVRNGISNPGQVADPSESTELVPIASTDLYEVESLAHSQPYLVPEAALLLNYIGERFHQLMVEQHPGDSLTRFIVTSALRTANDVERLRRRNANASSNSCHCYGTTIDITYIRFLDSDGNTVNKDYHKQILAQALLELRLEGLCYVKYELRQACFHLTVRETSYQGTAPSEICCYNMPQPPTSEYLLASAGSAGTNKHRSTPKSAKALRRGMEL